MSDVLRSIAGTVKSKESILVTVLLVFAISTAIGDLGFADEEEKRRVDISLSIFPRVVAVDNQFREKLVGGNNVHLYFLYSENEERAKELVRRIKENGKSIGGKKIVAMAISVRAVAENHLENTPTAMFVTERLSNEDIARVVGYAKKESRLVFSPFSGDVERGAAVGISVTNRVKPYFNLPTLKDSKIDINAILMKMSKRYE